MDFKEVLTTRLGIAENALHTVACPGQLGGACSCTLKQVPLDSAWIWNSSEITEPAASLLLLDGTRSPKNTKLLRVTCC